MNGMYTIENKGSIKEWKWKTDMAIQLAPKVMTMAMDYDSASPGLTAMYADLYDYVRYRGIELLAEQLQLRKITGAIAEAGVDMGLTSAILNRLFPQRRLYLYDTFERFPQDALDIEVELFNGDPKLAERWKKIRPDSNARIHYIREHLSSEENVYFRKGYFPETAIMHDAAETFAFVLLDMDLYLPMLEGIRFFYPRISSGGYLMLHDYNTSLFKGIHAAVEEAEKSFGRFLSFPLPDQGGSLVIIKP